MKRLYSIIGKSGSGKSYTSSKIVKKYYEDNIRDRIIIIDDSNDYISDKNCNFLNHVYLDNIGNRSGKIDYKELIRQKKYILFEFGGLTNNELQSFADEIVRAVYQLGNSLVVVEESYLFIPKSGKIEGFQRLISGGRKEGLDQIFVIQRPQDLNLLVFSQADILITFQLQEGRELQKISKYMGVKPEKIKELQQREMLIKYKDQIEKTDNNIIL